MDNLKILKLLYSDLAAWAQPFGGTVSASGTFVESLDVLSTRPGGFLAVIEWQGEDALSADPFSGVVEQNIGIYVAINIGLSAKKGEALWISPDGATLLERCNAVRDRMRSLVLPDDQSTSRYFNYRGARQVLLPDGTPLKAYRQDYTLENVLAQPDYRDRNV